MNVAIIGCGLIGQKRAKLLSGARLVMCVDHILDRAEKLANLHPHCIVSTKWEDAVHHPDVEIIIIATLHATLAVIGLAALQQKKHVFLEKPAGKAAHEIEAMMHASNEHKTLARVGFNHRYHRAFRKARELVDDGHLGELMFVRARYGHGGRVGYDQEWRADPLLSGGGELIDQGVHLIDLARWFLGDFTEINGFAHTYFWNMPVDDNGFLLLKTADKKTAFLHASCTEWKNLFSFELYGKKGKIEVNGLGGSYGTERITFYKMSEQMGPPETFAWEYPMADDSWEVEFAEFLEEIREQREPKVSLRDAHAALKIVEHIYKVS